MRRPLALLALAVLTWSNATVLHCAAPGVPADQRASEHHQHAGHGHTPAPSPDRQPPAHGHGGTSHPVGQDCGVMMPCGAAIGTAMGEAGPTMATTLATLPPAPLGTPSAADVSLDPPPPRRLA